MDALVSGAVMLACAATAPRDVSAAVDVQLEPGAPTIIGPGIITALPGDCNADWSIDMRDLEGLAACLSGPDFNAGEGCACYRLDDDSDVDLEDYRLLQSLFTDTQVLVVDLRDDADDGTEINDTDWHASGFDGSNVNRMGAGFGDSCDVGLRFHLPQGRLQ
jgi:hypothetical protein